MKNEDNLEIYQPAEDSYLMSKILREKIPKIIKENSELKFLEIGCGSGINLETAFFIGIKKKNILGADINPNAVLHCKNLGFKCVKSNLFENIKGIFDVIIFNPPYLPLDEKEPESSRVSTTGGKDGNEIIIRFLEQAKKHLSSKGKIILITSSLSKDVKFKDLGYVSNKISSEKLFFEELFVWELSVIK